jgi:N-terminal region of glycosyl transferase group 7/N-terminal domain of galactosyltransferase
MAFVPNPGATDARYNKRLAIVVPYRDRAQHLAQFVPHMVSYFERDKLDRQITFTINIIEQHGNAPFNRGRLGNSGFLLTQKESDYVCIHDVDYLPMWADYSWSSNPARLIWHGLSLKEDYYSFFGAVSLLDNAVFSKVNGFPNCYWGWGPEDRELGYRCRVQGFDVERRDGTYIPLRHQSAGFSAPHVWSDEGRRTNALYEKRQARLETLAGEDGVNSLKFELVEEKPLALAGGITVNNVWHYIVDLGPPDA